MIQDRVAAVAHGVVWFNIRPYNRDNIVRGQFLQDLHASIHTVPQDSLMTLPLVFDSRHEGHGQREYALILDALKNESWFDTNRCFWVNNVFGDEDSHVISIPWQMTNHTNFFNFVKEIDRDWSTLVREKKFVCLMRRQSPSRTQLAIQIIKRFNADDYVLSCSSMIFQQQFDYANNVRFPILIDGRVDQNKQHQLNVPAVFDCLINAVVETSNQRDAEQHAVWNSLFITEKTFKAFAWRQLPIWFAVPGTVQKIRSVGFDVFDDVFDNHCYDTIQDQDQRFQKVFEILDQALKLDYDIAKFIPRFQHNYQVLDNLDHNPMRSDQYIAKIICSRI